MKRQRDGVESIDLANCLMLLSRGKLLSAPPNLYSGKMIPECKYEGVESKPQNLLGPEEYECMTCNRKFSSFQALGGHRASHKKPKLDLKEGKKPKKHECSICGRVFSLGQALGGHMKTHRIGVDYGFSSMNRVLVKVPVQKRPNSKRVLFLDLNLTPLQNDLKLLFGDKAPKVDSFV